jgi:hypothetical protein
VSQIDPRPISRGLCPNCGAVRNAEVVAEDTVEAEEGIVWSRSTLSILRCLGCDRRYVRSIELFSEDTDYVEDPVTGELVEEAQERVSYWPSQIKSSSPIRRARPEWMWVWSELAIKYEELFRLLSELYDALDNNLPILATIGMRTVFDCASALLGADPRQKFAEKLKELVAGNKIGGEEKEILAVLADAGSAAAHRGWKPEDAEIRTLMTALEHFLHRAFVLKHEIRQLGRAIPPRDF